MTIKVKNITEPEVTCSNCQACCCRLEVMILTDTGVPEEHILVDKWGGETMLRLDDGWCSALDRETYMCSIYELRPWICREFEMGSYECQDERDECLGPSSPK
ncbi:YkgJ family cysteine cluster protein [Vibrio sinensis]|uniref:YkgJ family cysteine cluster protein n=1 Tax=Vibrio sinensis TaxID=2302434 RepID=A0A3A6QEF9_9VIBR|nr:YkgJ family cysteine cluster protein [Vibrio sinensis]RJX68394.1 YkgJ family cysteine cluster protein [Vibrio sinensis]